MEQDPRWSMTFTHVYVHMPAYTHLHTHTTYTWGSERYTRTYTQKHTHGVGGDTYTWGWERERERETFRTQKTSEPEKSLLSFNFAISAQQGKKGKCTFYSHHCHVHSGIHTKKNVYKIICPIGYQNLAIQSRASSLRPSC